MKTNVIENKGICGICIELNMFNVYKMQEMKKKLNALVKDIERYEELKPLGFDNMTSEQRKEFQSLKYTLEANEIKRIIAMFNNMLKDFKQENEDDLFTEPEAEKENATPIGTRENPRMFETKLPF